MMKGFKGLLKLHIFFHLRNCLAIWTLSHFFSFLDESLTKFYIRRRAITTYAPSNYQEPKNNGQAPTKKLQLDWVYPFHLIISVDKLSLHKVI